MYNGLIRDNFSNGQSQCFALFALDVVCFIESSPSAIPNLANEKNPSLEQVEPRRSMYNQLSARLIPPSPTPFPNLPRNPNAPPPNFLLRFSLLHHLLRPCIQLHRRNPLLPLPLPLLLLLHPLPLRLILLLDFLHSLHRLFIVLFVLRHPHCVLRRMCQQRLCRLP